MGPFALSVPSYRLGVHSRKKPRRQEQERRDVSQSPSPEPESARTGASSSRLPSDSINPLSHTPDTLRQLALAGLSPEDELPSKFHKDFPHRPIPSKKKKRRARGGNRYRSSSSVVYNNMSNSANESGVDSDSTVVAGGVGRKARVSGDEGNIAGRKDGEEGQTTARIRHLNTMTAIMHRCLRDGDIARAKRAFGLLVRTKLVDVRLNNLWAIGSEILMRDGEGAAVPSAPHHVRVEKEEGRDSDDENTDEEDDDDDELRKKRQERKQRRREEQSRWGTASNVEQVKTYLETLIQQHPHDPHRPHLTSAWDFWPALFGIEIYNLDAEFRAAQRRIRHAASSSSSSSLSSSPSSSASSSGSIDSDGGDDAMDLDSSDSDREEREDRDEGEDEDKQRRHQEIDTLRAETQRGALDIARRMDAVLENPPYNTRHSELLRLRAHVSLFVADLYLPSRLVDRYSAAVARMKRRGGSVGGGGQASTAAEGHTKVKLESGMRDLSLLKTSSSHLLRAKRGRPDEQVALGRRRAEQERARTLFRRALAAGAELEEWILLFLDPEEEEGDGGDDSPREQL